MGRLRDLPRSTVEAVLRGNGLEFKRNSKHDAIFVHPDDPTRRTGVPRHKTIRRGTLQSIMRDAKKLAEEFAD